MKALVYLTVKSLFNGVKRALTSPRRLIGILFLAGYYVFFFIRPFDRSPSRLSTEMMQTRLDAPFQVVHALIFALFSALTLILAMGIFAPRAGFRPADVDVLFPTPVNPRLVLIFRMFRDYMFTLLFPLLIALLSWRPASMGVEMLFNNLNPDTVKYLGRSWTLSWMLMSLAWVSVSYAVSMFVNRSDLDSDRNRRIFTGGTVAFIFLLSGYIFLISRGLQNTEDFVALAFDPVLRVVFFTATFATMAVMGPIQGNLVGTAIGLASLAAITIVSIQIALTQVGWLYDQAAAKGFDSLKTRNLQRQGDMMGVLAEQARRGKLKSGNRDWLNRIRMQGAWGLLWRDLAIQSRSMWGVLILFSAMVLVLTLLPILLRERGPSGYLYLVMQGFGAFLITTVVCQSGFIEFLRRGDLLKPLPFSPSVIGMAEVASKAMPAVLILWVTALVPLAFAPQIWPYVLAAVVLIPSVSLLFSASMFTLTVMFPDVEDPTQRGFRGMMTFLALAFLTGPVVLLFAGVAYLLAGFTIAPFIAGLTSSLLALALAWAAAALGGNMYASFNPSE
jgi:hypothetical protein